MAATVAVAVPSSLVGATEESVAVGVAVGTAVGAVGRAVGVAVETVGLRVSQERF